ncbi:MAG: HNH endonuclease [Chloroflexi bacterium]|nr:MAG: HNH endonuclease [Chloroflexota bacterium]
MSFDIVLGIKRSAHRNGGTDAEFERIKKSILARDNYQCQAAGCRFRAKQYLHVHHIDDDHTNNNPKNLITLCPLCHHHLHIGYVGSKCPDAKVVYWPDVSSSRFSAILKAAWMVETVTMNVPGVPRHVTNAIRAELKEQAKSLLTNVIPQLSDVAEQMLGTSSVAELAVEMAALPDKAYQKLRARLRGFHIAPPRHLYSKELGAWTATRLDKSIFNVLDISSLQA